MLPLLLGVGRAEARSSAAASPGHLVSLLPSLLPPALLLLHPDPAVPSAAAWCARPPGTTSSGGSILALPKSMSFRWPEASSSKFSGLRSRCTTLQQAGERPGGQAQL